MIREIFSKLALRKLAMINSRAVLRSLLAKKNRPAQPAVLKAEDAINGTKLASPIEKIAGMVKEAARRRGPHIGGEDTLQKLCNIAKNKE